MWTLLNTVIGIGIGTDIEYGRITITAQYYTNCKLVCYLGWLWWGQEIRTIGGVQRLNFELELYGLGIAGCNLHWEVIYVDYGPDPEAFNWKIKNENWHL